MNLIGLLAEYNPLHQGHIYHLKEIKAAYPDAKILVLMVGHFSQRGEPTILSKWERARLALDAGADLVFEFPFCGATSPAQGYGSLGMDILHRLGVKVLSFGCHQEDPQLLFQLAKKILDFKQSARMTMLKHTSLPYLLLENLNLSSQEKTLLDHGNDILALEYCQRILEKNYPMDIFPVLRSTSLAQAKAPYLSASSIREKVGQGQLASIKNFLPKGTYTLLKDVHFNYEEDLKGLYLYAWHFTKNRDFTGGQVQNFIYKDWIKNNKPLRQVSSKNFTNALVRREVLSLVFGYREKDRKRDLVLGRDYLRLLGAKKSALALLKNKPVGTKFTRGLKTSLSPIYQESLQETRLRNLLLKTDTPLDYSMSPLILD